MGLMRPHVMRLTQNIITKDFRFRSKTITFILNNNIGDKRFLGRHQRICGLSTEPLVYLSHHTLPSSLCEELIGGWRTAPPSGQLWVLQPHVTVKGAQVVCMVGVLYLWVMGPVACKDTFTQQ